jgi:hypothetical protein
VRAADDGAKTGPGPGRVDIDRDLVFPDGGQCFKERVYVALLFRLTVPQKAAELGLWEGSEEGLTADRGEKFTPDVGLRFEARHQVAARFGDVDQVVTSAHADKDGEAGLPVIRVSDTDCAYFSRGLGLTPQGVYQAACKSSSSSGRSMRLGTRVIAQSSMA